MRERRKREGDEKRDGRERRSEREKRRGRESLQLSIIMQNT